MQSLYLHYKSISKNLEFSKTYTKKMLEGFISNHKKIESHISEKYIYLFIIRLLLLLLLVVLVA